MFGAFTRSRYQVSVYRTIAPLASFGTPRVAPDLWTIVDELFSRMSSSFFVLF